MVFGEVGVAALRKENVDAIIKGIALQKFAMKPLCTVTSSNAWSESYYRESTTNLLGETNIARLGAFPVSTPTWEKNTAYMKKAGLEAEISWEDVLTNNIPVLARTQMRLAHRVVQMVDNTIYTALSSGARHTVTVPTDWEWDSTTRANRRPQEQIGTAIEKIQTSNYEPTHLLVNPHDYFSIISSDWIADFFAPTDADLIKNAVMGRLMRLKLVVSNVVPSDEALVLQARSAATYREAEAIRSAIEKTEGIKYVLRAWEIGTAFVTDPDAICKITGTKL